MGVDSLSGISNEQLAMMSMMENGSVNSSVNSGTSDQSNLAFALLMQNLIKSKGSNLEASEAGKLYQQTMTGANLKDVAMRMQNNPRIIYNTQSTYNSVSTDSNDEKMKKIYNAVNKSASKYGVDPNLVLAIIEHESDFQPNETSSAGAVGLMQVMPENFADNGITNGYDIDQNIDGGTKLLKTCLDLYGGDLKMGLMAYAAGPGTMNRRGVTSGSDLYKMPDETKKAVPEIIEAYKSRS